MLNDPTGPGSEAWELAELVIELTIEGKLASAQIARDKMLVELKICGCDDSDIKDWELDIEARIAEQRNN